MGGWGDNHVRRCPQCGRMYNADDARFCAEDGTALVADDSAEESPSSPSWTTTTTTASSVAACAPSGLPILAAGTLLGERYSLMEAIGGGGMAQVYRAIDRKFDREVAVKVIDPALRTDAEFDARFRREANILSKLSDPHIVTAHDVGIDPTHGPYLVMEFLRGQSLRQTLDQLGRLSPPAVLQIAEQILLALIHAHGKGIVHRDIKPDNVFLLEQSGRKLHVRILDFGIARIYRGDLDPTKDKGKLTLPGAVLGTPKYMSPEQQAGQPADERSDIYSLGVVLFEALTGQVYKIGGPSLTELCPDAPPSLQEWLAECTHYSPTRRPSSEVAFERLQRVIEQTGLSRSNTFPLMALPTSPTTAAAKPVPAAAPPPPATRRHWLRKVGLTLFGLTVLVGGVWSAKPWWWSSRSATSEQETLLGIAIGDSVDKLTQCLGPPAQRQTIERWTDLSLRRASPALELDDLGEAEQIALWLWDRGNIRAVLHGNEVRALVVRSEAAAAVTQRGIRIGASDRAVEKAYAPEEPMIQTVRDEDESKLGRCHIFRYDSCGIAFEVRSHKVRAIVLYTARPPAR